VGRGAYLLPVIAFNAAGSDTASNTNRLLYVLITYCQPADVLL